MVLTIRTEWQSAPGVQDAVLAASWGRLEIAVGDQSATDLVDLAAGSVRSAVYGSAFPLAEWIVESWWALLHEPCPVSPLLAGRAAAERPHLRSWTRRHNLLAAREGMALPDFTFARDGADLVLRWVPDPVDAHGTASTRIRFIGSAERRMAPEDVRDGLAGLVRRVLARLDDQGVETPAGMRLREEWAAIEASTRDEPGLCRALAVLGVDPYDRDEATDDLVAAVGRASALPSLLCDDLFEGATGVMLVRDLDWAERGRALLVEAPSPATGASGPDGAAHERGYSLAREVRGRLAHRRGGGAGPVANLDELLVRELGWSEAVEQLVARGEPSRLQALVGRARGGSRPLMVSPVRRPESARRFLLARAAYLALASDSGAPRLVSAAVTPDQRASRAFAAELLAPAEALAARVGGLVPQERIGELAQEFAVDPMVIAHQLVNHSIGQAEGA